MSISRTIRINRNQPCPCDSGKRFKHCHGIISTGKGEALDLIVIQFLEATNHILSLFDKTGNQVTLNTNFSIVLMRIYQGLMLEHFPSCQYQADKRLFFSFSVLCRSILDVIIQLKWIESLDEKKRENAIKLFLEFEGIGLNHKGKPVYDWQSLIDPSFSYREIAIKLNLDQEIINLNVDKVMLHQYETDKPPMVVNINDHKKITLTVFDYLSKTSHWNPRILNDLAGVNSQKQVGFTSEYLRLCTIELITFVSSTALFAEIFILHFFRSKFNEDLKKLEAVRAGFENFVIGLLKTYSTTQSPEKQSESV